MISNITPQEIASANESYAFITTKSGDFSSFSEAERAYISTQIDNDQTVFSINAYTHFVYFHIVDTSKDTEKTKEAARKAASKVCTLANKEKIKALGVVASAEVQNQALAFAEGLVLSSYQFLKYYKDADKRRNSLQSILLAGASEYDVVELNAVTKAVWHARELVNEPVISLNAEGLAKEIEKTAEEAGFTCEVLDKAQIEELKMGGLLGVNKGSIDPPTFSIMEWKPANAVNEKPIVIVGKGVVFDTGGLSLKPTPNSMDFMKADMGGAAATLGAVEAAAKAKLPVYVVGIVPATDNRPGGNAITPCDVLTMHNGLTVEVLNTDAEGRLILADGLSYASEKYDAEITFDIATLTGAAARAIGSEASVVMGTASDQDFADLATAGLSRHERVFQFPFWEEYGEQIKSPVADIKNMGGPEAGAITAGKFLEHFVTGPWIHIDIAGPMWAFKANNYFSQGSTGVGVRLLFEYLKNRANKAD